LIMKGRSFVWFGASAFSVAIIYYCMFTLVKLMQYLNNFTLM